jgi:PKD repeat protein
MIKKTVKYGKFIAVILILLVLLYLLLTSSIFDSENPSVEEEPIDDEYNFTIKVYEQNSILVQLEDDKTLENGNVLVEYEDNLSTSNHTISVSGKGSFEIIDIQSSTLISKIEIRKNRSLLYEEYIDYKPSNTNNKTNITVQNISDQEILLRESLELNATNYINNSQINRLSFSWDMGDDTQYNSPNIRHNYTSAGQYKAQLTVTRNQSSKIVAFNVTVNTEGAISEIVAPRTVKVGEEITFNGDASTTIFAQRSEWVINGTIYTESNPTLTFEKSGVYEVILTAESQDGEIDIASYRLVVQSE